MVLYDLKGKLDKIKEHMSNFNCFLDIVLTCVPVCFSVLIGLALVMSPEQVYLIRAHKAILNLIFGIFSILAPVGIGFIGANFISSNWDLDDIYDLYDDPSVLTFIVNSAYIVLLWLSWTSGWFVWHKFLIFSEGITGILIVYTLVSFGINLYLYLKERSYKKLGESKEYKRMLPVITEICDRWDNGSEGYDKSKVINGLNAVYNGGKLEYEIELSKKVITVFKYVFTYGITPDPPQITDYISGSSIKVYGSNITTTTTTLAPGHIYLEPRDHTYKVEDIAYYGGPTTNYGTPTPKFSPDPKSQGEDHYSKYLSLSASLYESSDALNTSQSILAESEGNTARISKALQKLLVAVRFICDSVMNLETFDKVSSKVYNDEESLDSLNLIFTEFNKDIKEIKKDVEERSKKLKEQQEQLKQQRESLLDKSFKNKTRGLDQYTKNMGDKHE